MKDFLGFLTGHMPTATFFAAMFFALIGQLMFKRVTYSSNPSKKKPHNPVAFNIWYWLKDNAMDMSFGLLGNYVLVIFAKDIIKAWHPEWLTYFDNPETMAIFAVLGFAQSPLYDLAKKWVRVLRGTK